MTAGAPDRAIVDAVIAALQPAEEISGPDGADYVATMRAIADLAIDRVRAYAGDRAADAVGAGPRMFAVLAPIERRDGGIYRMRVGTAYPRPDGEIGIYLDALPFGHRLIVRPIVDDPAPAAASTVEARP